MDTGTHGKQIFPNMERRTKNCAVMTIPTLNGQNTELVTPTLGGGVVQTKIILIFFWLVYLYILGMFVRTKGLTGLNSSIGRS